MSIKKGSLVRLIQPIIEGVVLKTEYDEDTEQLKHLVGYADADGETQERWFGANSLEVTK